MLSKFIQLQLYTVVPTLLAPQILGFWVTCQAETMPLRHGRRWGPPQTASHIHISHIQSVWAHWYAVQRHIVAALYSLYPPYLAQILWFWFTCWAKMMPLRHGWGWQPSETASPIHIKHIQSVWAHWYAVKRHTVAALYSYTHHTWLRFRGIVDIVILTARDGAPSLTCFFALGLGWGGILWSCQIFQVNICIVHDIADQWLLKL